MKAQHVGNTTAHWDTPPGTHICQLVSRDDERFDVLGRFIADGVAAGGKTSCFSDLVQFEQLTAWLKDLGPTLEAARQKGQFVLHRTDTIYFKNGRFDPDVMLEQLSRHYDATLTEGYSCCRVIGEMNPQVSEMSGGDRLAEYEARVTLLMRSKPLIAVCQYDVALFSGKTIMEVLRVHPKMIIRGQIVENPFYVSPEEYLAHRAS